MEPSFDGIYCGKSKHRLMNLEQVLWLSGICQPSKVRITWGHWCPLSVFPSVSRHNILCLQKTASYRIAALMLSSQQWERMMV